jgi:hypothetical protein
MQKQAHKVESQHRFAKDVALRIQNREAQRSKRVSWFSTPVRLAPKLKRTGHRLRSETRPQDLSSSQTRWFGTEARKDRIEKKATLVVWNSVLRFSIKSVLLLAPGAQLQATENSKQRWGDQTERCRLGRHCGAAKAEALIPKLVNGSWNVAVVNPLAEETPKNWLAGASVPPAMPVGIL